MNKSVSENYLNEILHSFRNYKTIAEKSFAQITDAEFFQALDAEANSVAIIVKHLAGNFRSRWTDFLTTDGEKPDRNRDAEFITAETETKKSLLEFWENGWLILLTSIESLTPTDLSKTVRIRGEAHTVVAALNRALAHCAYHVGQIVFLAKHFRSSDWRSLSIPRDQSEEFNQRLRVSVK